MEHYRGGNPDTAGIVSPLRFTSNLTTMKCKVIKEYAGIEAGQEIEVNDKVVNHLIESGYVEQIIEVIEPIKAKHIAQEQALNKAIEPKYKRNR